jgi:uncharacterized protein YjbI with pentapeptide repeats
MARPYLVSYAGQNLGNVTGRRFVRADLSGCTIGIARAAQFIHCNMRGARFTNDDPRDLISISATLNCETWESLTLPPRSFEALLKLMSITNCGEQKREGLRALIDPQWLATLDRSFPDLE